MRLRVALLIFAVSAALGSGLFAVSVARHPVSPVDVAVASTPVPRLVVVEPPAAPSDTDGWLAAAPRAARPFAEPGAVPFTDPELDERIAELLADPELPEDGGIGVLVTDAEGRPLLARHADEPLVPASTQKLVTAAATLTVLGEEHRFRTELRATVAPDADGVIDGDLVLVGGGDPTLATEEYGEEVYPARPRTSLDALADAVVDAGVTRVRGDVVGDASWLPDEPLASGWPERYLRNGDATRSSGLTVNAGRRLFTQDGRLVSEPADRPGHEAAAQLAALLEERDVRLDGAAAEAGEPPDAPHGLAAADSPPLAALAAFTVQRSDNHLADALFRALGRHEGDGSWASADAAVRAALAELGLVWDGVVLADGSGLSRDDRLTARFLVELDLAMTGALGGRWQELMASSGQSGTLRRRLGDTVADGRVFGKTGTLRDVRSLSGVVLGPEGRRYHFAVIGSGLESDEVAAVRRFQDELLLALTEDLYECVHIPIEPDSDEDEEADETELVCAA